MIYLLDMQKPWQAYLNVREYRSGDLETQPTLGTRHRTKTNKQTKHRQNRSNMEPFKKKDYLNTYIFVHSYFC
jgi:hypothetical protein